MQLYSLLLDAHPFHLPSIRPSIQQILLIDCEKVKKSPHSIHLSAMPKILYPSHNLAVSKSESQVVCLCNAHNSISVSMSKSHKVKSRSSIKTRLWIIDSLDRVCVPRLVVEERKETSIRYLNSTRRPPRSVRRRRNKHSAANEARPHPCTCTCCDL